MMRATLVWFRQDLRVEDNAALVAAARRGAPVIPVYIWSPGEQGDWAPGAAARWWLHHSLGQLDASLRRLGSRLIIGRGRALKVLRGLVRRTGADTIAWNRRYQPAAATRDAETRAGLERDGLAVKVFESALLFDPADIRTRQGGPLRVFTPFWRACLAQPAPAEPTSAPGRLASPSTWPESLAVDELGLLPSHDWTEGLAAAWTPGELDARAELNRFLDEGLASYELDRDRPSLMGTSRLSPYLCWGELGPRQVWHAVREWAIDADDERIAHNARSFSANSAGASSATICCTTFHRRSRSRYGRSLPVFRGDKTPGRYGPGSMGEPAIPWSTRACANCGRRVGCTIGSAWWWRRSW